jgi:lysophospholipase L1-like esterase
MDPERIAEEIDAYNAIKRQETGQAGVAFVDVTPISRRAAEDPSLIAGDGLHPSGKMYAEWVELILPVAEQILKTSSKQKP